MVAGHLREKNGYYYAVLNYNDAFGKRKTKWIATGLTVKGNKKKAEAFLMEERQKLQPEEPVEGDIFFADYMEQWLDVVKSSIAVATYASYAASVKRIIAPYFRERRITLKELTAKDIQDFYLFKLKSVSASSVIHYHANMNVTLENFNLSHVPVYIMSQDQLSMYATYMSVVGNREDLFPDSPYVDKYIENPPDEYTVNPSYLSDETFSTLITEAEKYLNYPYVWGGSNPETSFDCSGFVSYVLTNSGLVNTGRLGAQGLYNVCTPVSRADAKPGDLVFFVGTYDTPGVSHVGIYVGDGVMLHCGDPIQYSSINTSYWQSHFYAFGRPNY